MECPPRVRTWRAPVSSEVRLGRIAYQSWAVAGDSLFLLIVEESALSLLELTASAEGVNRSWNVVDADNVTLRGPTWNIGLMASDPDNVGVFWMMTRDGEQWSDIEVRSLRDGALEDVRRLEHSSNYLSGFRLARMGDDFVACVLTDNRGLYINRQPLGSWYVWEQAYRNENGGACLLGTDGVFLRTINDERQHELYELPNTSQPLQVVDGILRDPPIEGPFGLAVEVISPDDSPIDRAYVLTESGEATDVMPAELLEDAVGDDSRRILRFPNALQGSMRVDQETWAYVLRENLDDPRLFVVSGDGRTRWLELDSFDDRRGCTFHVSNVDGVILRWCEDEVLALDVGQYLAETLTCDGANTFFGGEAELSPSAG